MDSGKNVFLMTRIKKFKTTSWQQLWRDNIWFTLSSKDRFIKTAPLVRIKWSNCCGFHTKRSNFISQSTALHLMPPQEHYIKILLICYVNYTLFSIHSTALITKYLHFHSSHLNNAFTSMFNEIPNIGYQIMTK